MVCNFVQVRGVLEEMKRIKKFLVNVRQPCPSSQGGGVVAGLWLRWRSNGGT
jgi:hypothetical protein